MPSHMFSVLEYTFFSFFLECSNSFFKATSQMLPSVWSPSIPLSQRESLYSVLTQNAGKPQIEHHHKILHWNDLSCEHFQAKDHDLHIFVYVRNWHSRRHIWSAIEMLVKRLHVGRCLFVCLFLIFVKGNLLVKGHLTGFQWANLGVLGYSLWWKK